MSTNAREYEKAINFYKEGLTYDDTHIPVRVHRKDALVMLVYCRVLFRNNSTLQHHLWLATTLGVRSGLKSVRLPRIAHVIFI